MVDLRKFTAEIFSLLGSQRARAEIRKMIKTSSKIMQFQNFSKICCLVYNIDTPGWGMLYLGLEGVSNKLLDILLRGKLKEWDLATVLFGNFLPTA